jgi:hypothetical protein
MHSLFHLELEFELLLELELELELLESMLEFELPRVANIELLAVEVEDACYIR